MVTTGTTSWYLRPSERLKPPWVSLLSVIYNQPDNLRKVHLLYDVILAAIVGTQCQRNSVKFVVVELS
jgi:hypothetical protein